MPRRQSQLFPEMSSLPSLSMFLRSKGKFEGYTGKNQIQNQGDLLPPTESSVCLSDDGKILAVPNEASLDLFHVREGASLIKFHSIPCKAHSVQFSPRNSFIVIWQRPENMETENTPNLGVWDLRPGSFSSDCHPPHITFFQKKPFLDSPYIHWTHDEFVAARLVSNEVHFFDGFDLSSGITSKLRLEKVTMVSFAPVLRDATAPKKTYKFLAYCPGSAKKSQPSSVTMYRYPDFTPLSSKSSYTSDQVELSWSCNGQVALVKGTTEMVKESYYGSSKLFFLNGKGESLNVVRDGSESIADAQWSPVEKEFIVIQGRTATLYEGRKCEAVFEFGSSAWNAIRWSPHGDLIMLGGFGNMAGDMRFWHRQTLKEIGFCSAQGSKVFEWAPDGIRFITANLHPWRRVDNCLKVWKYTGELLQKFDYTELYQVTIQRNIGRAEFPPANISAEEAAKLEISRKKTESVASMKYIPPSLRKKGGASKFKLNSNQGPRMLKPVVTANAVKPNGGIKPISDVRQSQPKPKETPPKPKEIQPKPKETPKDDFDESYGCEESEEPDKLEKKLKMLNKKLRQINDLKKAQANGEEMDQFKLGKISKESFIISEIEKVKALSANR